MYYVYGIYVKNSRFPFYVGSGLKIKRTFKDKRNHMVKTMIDNNETEFKIIGEFDNKENSLEVESLIQNDLFSIGHCECCIVDGNGIYLREDYLKELGNKISNKNKGRKHSKEWINKLSGENHYSFKGWYVSPEGHKYSSGYEAEKETGISYKTIYRYCKNNKHGWTFEPKEN